jgi:hypothetical protein
MCDRCAVNPKPARGSRRRRLWELPMESHCPVVGVCFALSTLRQMVMKVQGVDPGADDYSVHETAVAACRQRGPLSEQMQRELDKRHRLTVEAFKPAKDETALAALWADAVGRGDVAAALWAVLTHPWCDGALEGRVLRDMHMLQHQAGAAARVEVSRFNAVVAENGILARELGRVQERCTRLLEDRTRQIEALRAEALHLRALIAGRDARIANLNRELDATKSSPPGFEDSTRRERRLRQLAARVRDVEARNARLRDQLGRQRRMAEAQSSDRPILPVAAVPATGHSPDRIGPALVSKTVVCVGGRPGNVAGYRDLVEQTGARFAHHDGGIEDHQGTLDAVLSAADLVICQTGCISHNAYWRVKDFCRRTGKRCVFVDNPSTSSLARSLKRLGGHDEASASARAVDPGAG